MVTMRKLTMPGCRAIFAFDIVLAVLILTLPVGAQNSPPASKPVPPPASSSPAGTSSAPVGAKSSQDWSGMYTFLKEGEFVQLTVEDDGQVTGFVSRYGDGESDKGAFLDQFFKSGKLDSNKLVFETEVVHGVWFNFKGMVERGAGKNSGDEAYYVLKGSLTESSTDANKKVTAYSHEVVFKMFPQEAGAGPAPASATPGNPVPRN